MCNLNVNDIVVNKKNKCATYTVASIDRKLSNAILCNYDYDNLTFTIDLAKLQENYSKV